MNLIKKIYSELKTNGLKKLILKCYNRVVITRSNSFKNYKQLFQNKYGLEIGGPSNRFDKRGIFPVYNKIFGLDNCNFGKNTVWEGEITEGFTFRYSKKGEAGRQYICEGTDLSQMSSSYYDFVLSSHTLEHIANPIKALLEWIRVLKEDGLLVVIVPHKDGTFDHRRSVTSLEHLIQDFEQDTTESDLTHLQEIFELHDLSKDPPAGDFNSFKQRSERNLENRCLHHHVFDTRLAVELINYMNMQIISVEARHPCDIIIVAQKPVRKKSVNNQIFRGIMAKPCWISTFNSDQIDQNY